MDADLKAWRDMQRHLPEFMRDFHNCKQLFKGISEHIICDDDHPANDVNWKQAHCYTIDVFLWFMAKHGFTLQRSRARKNFEDLDALLDHLDAERKKASAAHFAAAQGGEIVSKAESFWCHEASNIRCVRESDYERLEQERAEQWRFRRDAEAGRDTANAVAAELRAQVEAMRAALNAVMTMDVNGHQLQDRLQFSTKGREILDKVNAALQAKP